MSCFFPFAIVSICRLDKICVCSYASIGSCYKLRTIIRGTMYTFVRIIADEIIVFPRIVKGCSHGAKEISNACRRDDYDP
jgi:hypothetical protein